jgi:prefoldin subunit 5
VERQQDDELDEEIEALRQKVAQLSEAIADCRALRLHQREAIARLRRELIQLRSS